MKNKRLWFIGVIICLVSVSAYLPALNNNFVNWDDIDYVYENPYLKMPVSDFVVWALGTSRTGYWHPLTWLSLRADYALWGLNPTGYHLTSVLFHGLNTLLVVLLAGSLIMRGPPLKKSSVIFGASVAGIIFGLHPFHVESVAWISERKDVLYSFFWLISLLAYMGYASSSSLRRKVILFLLCFISFSLSLLSKPMAATLPLVLLILDFYPLKRLNGMRDIIKTALLEKLPFFLLSAAVSFTTVIMQKQEGAMNLMEQLSLMKRIAGAVKALGLYLAKIAWPVNLVPFYPLDPDISLFTVQNMLSLLLILAITAVGIKLWRKIPLLIAAWSYFLLTVLPVLGIVQFGSQAMADRYMYLSIAGPIMIVASLGAVSWQKNMKVRYLFVTVFLCFSIFISVLTVKQISVWKDSVTLWEYVISKEPVSSIAHNNLGAAYDKQGRLEDAVREYMMATQINPMYASPHNNLGTVYEKLGRTEDAIKEYMRALQIKPDYAEVHYNMGKLYDKQRRFDIAVKEYLKAIKINPDYAEAHNNLAIAYASVGRIDDAIKEFRAAIKINPGSVKVHNNLGIMYARQGNTEDAVKEFLLEIKINPGFYSAHYNLGVAYKSQSRLKEAVKEFQTALRLNPDHAGARKNLETLARGKE
jgi:tetratricopeptide (TPR) repeat protein